MSGLSRALSAPFFAQSDAIIRGPTVCRFDKKKHWYPDTDGVDKAAVIFFEMAFLFFGYFEPMIILFVDKNT